MNINYNLKNDKRLMSVLKEYFDISKIESVYKYGNSPINEKYLVKTSHCEYILQRINEGIFTSPHSVFHNIELVTEKIKSSLLYRGDNCYRSLVFPIQNKYDEKLTIVNDEYWRCTNKIEGSIIYNQISSNEMAFSIGRLIGSFQELMIDFNPNLLDSTIPNIHNLVNLYSDLKDAYTLLDNKEKIRYKKEYEFISLRVDKQDLITRKLDLNIIPYRVNHNGISVSEIVFDKETNEATTYLSMDAIMKGPYGGDLGNALRKCCSFYEKEKDGFGVTINYAYFEAIIKGYYNYANKFLTKAEKESLFDNYYSVVYEHVILHLLEHIEKTSFAKLEYEDENLDRCNKQIALLREIEENEVKIKYIFNKYFK